MSTPAQASVRNRKRQVVESLVTLGLFFLILAVPLVLVGLGIGRDNAILKNGEYRLPAPRPAVPRSVSAAVAFPWAWEDYWRDAFPYRGPMIHLQARARYGWLGANAPRQIFLKDGFVFGYGAINAYRGKSGWSDAEVDDFLKILLCKREFFQRQGVAYYFVLAPSREGFYRDLFQGVFHLPEKHALKAKIEARMAPEIRRFFIAPDETMREARSRYPDRPLFFKRDNHWNQWGRAVAASAIVRFLQADFPRLPPLDPAEIPFVAAPEDQSFWANVRLLGLDFDTFPAPMTVMAAPEWAEQYRRLEAAASRSPLKLVYASDSFMEILADRSPEILSFGAVKRVGGWPELGSPVACQKVLAEHPDVVLESVDVAGLALGKLYFEVNAPWLAADP